MEGKIRTRKEGKKKSRNKTFKREAKMEKKVSVERREKTENKNVKSLKER